MEALVCTQPQTMVRETRPVPAAGPGEVVLKVKALGICGSDIHAFHGRQPMFAYPQVMGHEISAEVVSCGDGVAGFQAGQHVLVIPYKHCGKCVACRRGRTTCCTDLSVMGVHRTGAMQEYIAVEAEYVIASEGIPHEDAALVEPYSISAHAVRRSGVVAGEWALVAGAGTIGLGAADIARGLGAKIILADPNRDRLEAARRNYGFEVCLDPLAEDYAAKLKSITDGDGPVVIIDATGNAQSMNSQMDKLAASGTLVFVGLHNDKVCFDDLAFHKREVNLLGSRAATREDFELVIDLALQGKINLGKLRSQTVRFAGLDQDGFNDLTSPKIVKSVVLFD